MYIDKYVDNGRTLSGYVCVCVSESANMSMILMMIVW